MQLAHKEEDEIFAKQYRQMNRLEREIRDLEKSIEAEEKEINNLTQAIEILNGNIKVTCFFVAVAVILFVRVFVIPYGFFLDMIVTPHISIPVFSGTIAFIVYTVKRVKKYFPMYIHCRQEEKGGSADLTNYVYQIKRHERMKADYIKELEIKMQEFDNPAGK